MNAKCLLPILLLAHVAVLRPAVAARTLPDEFPGLGKALESCKAVLGPQKAKPRKRRRPG